MTAPAPVLLDVESRSRADLPRVGGRRYWEHPSSHVLVVVWYDTADGTVGAWYPGDAWPHDGRTLAAHNAHGFDRFALERYGITAPWIDTAQLARRAGLPGALDALGTRWCGVPKDREASRFTKSLSSVRRPSRKHGAAEIPAAKWATMTADERRERGVQPVLDADGFARVVSYCASDVAIMAQTWPRLREWLDVDADVAALDVRINDRGVWFDARLAQRLLDEDACIGDAAVDDAAVALASSFDGRGCTAADVWDADRVRAAAMSPAKFCAETGAPNAQAATVETMTHPLAAVRKALSSIAAGKLRAGLARVHADGRLRDTLVYYGAHAQPLSEPVATPSGWRRMGDLAPGDYVLGTQGPTRVRAVYPQGARDVVRVTFSDGAFVRCDLDHLWSVRDNEGRERVLSVRDMLRGGYRRNNGTRARYTVPMTSHNTEPSNLPIDPYTLGALLGDGCFRNKTPGFTSADPEIAARFALPAGVYLTDRIERKASGKDAHHYTLASGTGGRWRTNPLKAALVALGLWGLGSRDKFIPDEYLWASREQRLDLLCGLLDTDGSARSAGVAKYTTTSLELARGVVHLVESLGGTVSASVGVVKSGGIVEIGCNMPIGLSPFYLNRKRTRHEGKARAPYRSIVSINRDGREPCQCIEVEASDHLYLARSFVATHNTGRWSGRGMQLHNLPRPAAYFGDLPADTTYPHTINAKGERVVDVDALANEVLAGRPCDADAVALLVRATIAAPPGRLFAVRDFASIEARATVWAAGDEAALDVYRSDRDPYKVAAADVYGVAYDDVTKPQRQVGKVCTLALGYGGGPAAFEKMASAYRVDLSALDVRAIVDAWRRARRPVVSLWYACEHAFRAACDGKPRYAGPFEFVADDEHDAIACFLPSGRPIVYNEAHVDGDGDLAYVGARGVEHVYGGKLVENAIQGLCRDLLTSDMLAVDAAGLDIVMHVHDEIVVECAPADVEHVEAVLDDAMTTAPAWAAGFPLACDGWTGRRYRK